MLEVANRFDKFQAVAVSNIVEDFGEDLRGRYLLVVPTGGGKTFTAVKAINALFAARLFNPLEDRVAWIAHRRELLSQAENAFRQYELKHPDRPTSSSQITYLMLSQVKEHITNSIDTKLVVIDEAHHGAANSYQPIFARPDVGVLGLTATPTRHDGRQLEFTRESYSIGFPDLVNLGVILRPIVETIRGGRYDIQTIDDQADLATLNNRKRNGRIIKTLLAHPEKYEKVVVYVGTRIHVTDLYKQMINSDLRDHYESIAWITGDGNSRSEERSDFLRRESAYRRSILINIHVLSEGYDDPSINTVVMASPTRSKLVYMQAMGRAIRRDPNNDLKKAYIIEIIDELPNIRYRIDNRWLYADISDALEPAVIDRQYATKEELRLLISTLCREYGVPKELVPKPTLSPHYRYGLLLFKVYRKPGEYFHYPLWIDNTNRQIVSNFFNFLSERMPNYVSNKINSEAAFRMVDYRGVDQLSEEKTRRYIYDAMENAASDGEAFSSGQPWITYVSFQLIRSESHLPSEVLEFLEDMVNGEEIMTTLLSGAYTENSVLLRLPLPLQSYVGKIVTKSEFVQIDAAVNRLHQIKLTTGATDHRKEVNHILQHTIIPLEPAYGNSLITIAREDLTYSVTLT